MTGRGSVTGASTLAFVLYLAFVIYGSLVPLAYQALPFDDALRRFARIPFLELSAESRADWIANGVLYVPLGLMQARLMQVRLGWSVPAAFVVTVALCTALALAVEFTQLFFPPRTVSQNDLIAELLGSAIGACLATVLRPWAQRLRHALAVGSEGITTHVLEAYALLYLVLSFFPYDLALSGAELQARIAGNNWSWLIVRGEQGLVTSLLQLVVELLLCMPLGWLWQRRRVAGGTLIAPAAKAGALLGLAIEIGQFFVLSGYSQGASVLTRAAAFALGATTLPLLMKNGAAAMRVRMRAVVLPMLLLWLPMLLWVNGWFRNPLQGASGAAASWRELHLMPFYYHYFTTEAVALFSLGTVSLMYLPLLLACWLRQWTARASLGAVAVTVVVVETSKLFLVGMRPDPTNVIIALSACALAWWLLVAWERPGVAAWAVAAPASSSHSPVPVPAPWPWLMVAAAGLGAMLFPVLPWVLASMLLLAALLVWRCPMRVLLIVPAALPVLDAAPWSGRLYLDEFDLLLAACLGVAWLRTTAAPRVGVASSGAALVSTVLASAVAVSLVVGTLRGMLPWTGLDANALATLGGPLAPLRIVKGALWAGLFLLLWRRLPGDGVLRARWFGGGLALGLALTVLCVIWERLAFGVFWDFAADMRVTAMFSAMSKGGAYIECFLALACAFVVAEVFDAEHGIGRRLAWLLLLAAAVYALMVTYSRNGYAAFVAMLLVSSLVLWRRRPGTAALWPLGLLVAGVAVAVAIPIGLGPFASARLASLMQDLQVRQAHWRDALLLRAPGWDTTLFGEGIGRFPERHYWNTQEPVRAGSYRLVNESGQRFLRLGPGAPLYIEQIVPRPADGPIAVSARLRSSKAGPQLALSLCEKWTLTSRGCTSLTLVPMAAAAPGAWHSVRGELQARPASEGTRWAGLPTKLSLVTPAGDASIDVDDLRLRDASGAELLHNGGFSDGMDRWYFATDVDPPWHIHSLPVALLFDQGWFGLFAWSMLLLWALVRAARRWRRGDLQAVAPAAALVAFGVSGTLNTLIDEPRFLWLLLVLVGLCIGGDRKMPGSPA